jgi:mercuric ion transport protein
VKAYLDKIGPLGTILTALCCIGTPGLLAFLSAIGVGFLINDAILLPLLVIFLAISVMGLYSSIKTHGNRWPLILGGTSSIFVLFFIFGWFLKPMVYVGLIGLVGTSVWNIFLGRHIEKDLREV